MNYKEIPIFINSFNRPTFLMQLIYKLHSMGYENLIIIDNGSTDPVTPVNLKNCGYNVVFIGSNKGHNVIWTENVLENFGYKDSYYVYTDCDIIPEDNCPNDFMEVFLESLHAYLGYDKCGFGLTLEHLPSHYKNLDKVLDWEIQHQEKIIKSSFPVMPVLYHAAIDTTFALYKPGAKFHSLNSIRTGFPYIAKHLPWYENSSKPFFELEYYRKSILPNESSWETEGLNKR